MLTIRVALLAVMAVVLPACAGRAAPRAPSTATAAPSAATAGTSPAAAASPSVPAEYAPMADSLARNLDLWEQQLRGRPLGLSPTFATELLAANSNRGDALLAPSTLAVVDASLTRLKQLGVGGVTIAVSFPLLNPGYPRSAEYLAFYREVARRVRAQGLAIDVEQHVVFSGTPFSDVHFDYATLPLAQFTTQFREMTRVVIDAMHPDYLTLLSEPDTFAKLTGYREVATPQGAAAMIRGVVQDVDRGTTKLGAGAGSWLADAADYDAAFARLPLDYIDLHIYPVTAASIDVAQRAADAARAAGKPVVLDEAWLYKLGPNERSDSAFDAATAAFRRDVFSFWSPLDARFLTLLAQFSRANNVVFVSPFWSTYFWGNVGYSAETRDLPYKNLEALANEATLRALRDGSLTPTGQAYRALVGR